jgi:Mor family transcriptional regulator
MNFDGVEHLLPDSLQTLIRVIGMPTALLLVKRCPGTTVDVPKRQSRLGEIGYEKLSELVGAEVVDRMVQHFGGDRLYIPKCNQAMREQIARAIRREFDQMTARECCATQAVSRLAVRYLLSDRHIWRVLKRTDKMPQEADSKPVKQGELFQI